MCREQSLRFEQIGKVRQEKSFGVLESLGKWMKEQWIELIPKSAIGKAIAYALERWKRLSLYAENGMLSIEINPVENSIRPVALGRKNYLFAGSHQAAQRSAMLYIFLGTCKMYGIEPYSWSCDTLEKIATHPINRIFEHLPHNIRK